MQSDPLSATFAALADPTRRAILARLALGETSVTELAEPFDMSLPAVSKHLKVLERAGLVTRGREAQWRPCKLDTAPMQAALGWLDQYKRFWDDSFDRLDDYLQQLQKGTPMANATNPETLVLSRTLNAPRALVWKAFTERGRLAQWWGPKGMKVEVSEFELKPGGKMIYSMENPQGVMWGRWVFTEITPPEKLGFIVSFSDEQGGVTRAPFFDNWPLEVQSQFVFQEEGDKTVLVMTGFPINAAEDERARFVSMHDSMRGGWSGTFEQLEAYLAGASFKPAAEA